jgi:holo-[acyl-carrier protein] synthase
MLERSPNLADRFFTDAERAYCQRSADFGLHLAATLAAKEAVMKALGLVPAAATAPQIEIIRTTSGRPIARVEGREVTISISHDGPVVVAVAIAES